MKQKKVSNSFSLFHLPSFSYFNVRVTDVHKEVSLSLSLSTLTFDTRNERKVRMKRMRALKDEKLSEGYFLPLF